MLRILKMFVDMCLLRANPQDLPHSLSLEIFALCVYTGLSFLVAQWSTVPEAALTAALVDVCMMVALTWGGLWAVNLQSRATKTITALAGTGALWQLATLPLIAMLSGESADSNSVANALSSLVFLAMITWVVIIIGHILRHALNMKFFFGIGIAVLYVYTSMRVGSALLVAAQTH